jgi:phosphatidylglycerophosphate synthase
MVWSAFVRVAFPPEMALREAGKSSAWKLSRRIALIFAYSFYKLGFSANMLSILRVFLAGTALFLLYSMRYGYRWLPIGGLALMIWQVNLDHADGPIARATNTASPVGKEIDGLANAFSRMAMITLCGLLADCTPMLFIGLFTAYMVIYLPAFSPFLKVSKIPSFVRLCRRSFSVPAMLAVLPAIICGCNLLQLPVAYPSTAIVLFYFLLSWSVIFRAR